MKSQRFRGFLFKLNKKIKVKNKSNINDDYNYLEDRVINNHKFSMNSKCLIPKKFSFILIYINKIRFPLKYFLPLEKWTYMLALCGRSVSRTIFVETINRKS